jgi:uroporphyrinogen decarboxylase
MGKLKNCLIKKDPACVPVWFMRQAGRYLPEFQKIRAQNKNFIDLCLNSSLSSEITLQPLKRFNLDAAIIFSDILMVPFALGQNVKFEKNEGPVLSPFDLKFFSSQNKKTFIQKLNPIYEAISISRKKLDNEKSLISFIGAPWTLIVYMLGLKVKKNQIDKKKILKLEHEIEIILDEIDVYLCLHIEKQIEAGADVVQIFDSWSGLIPENKLHEYCYKPNKKIVDYCKKKNIPVICFPKGIKNNYVNFANFVKPDCLSLDYEIEPTWAIKNLSNFCLQGGMDPMILFENENRILQEVDKYLNVFKNHPYIFNLGHGLLPETSPEIVQKIVERVNNFK